MKNLYIILCFINNTFINLNIILKYNNIKKEKE